MVAFAYVGHAGSLSDPREKQAVNQIETDEWNHRKCVLGIMQQYNIPISKFYEVKFDEPIFFTNKLAIWIDRNLECPFYLTSKQIFVFGEKTAVQLVLFSGNIAKFQRAQERFTEKST